LSVYEERNTMKPLYATILGLCLAITSACAGEAPKLAVVDMDGLIKAHPRYQTNRDIVRKQLEAAESDRDALVKELTKMKEEFIEARRLARDPAIGESVRTEREAKVKELGEALQKKEEAAQDTLLKRQRELSDQQLNMRKTMEELVRAIVREYAADEKLDLVLDKSAVGVSGSDTVVYNREALDITDAVMKRMGAAKPE